MAEHADRIIRLQDGLIVSDEPTEDSLGRRSRRAGVLPAGQLARCPEVMVPA